MVNVVYYPKTDFVNLDHAVADLEVGSLMGAEASAQTEKSVNLESEGNGEPQVGEIFGSELPKSLDKGLHSGVLDSTLESSLSHEKDVVASVSAMHSERHQDTEVAPPSADVAFSVTLDEGLRSSKFEDTSVLASDKAHLTVDVKPLEPSPDGEESCGMECQPQMVTDSGEVLAEVSDVLFAAM